MPISARNQLSGTVTNVKKGIVTAEVTVELEGGQEIVSVITLTSVENLGIEVGSSVYAVVKATEVMLGIDEQARQEQGVIERLATIEESHTAGRYHDRPVFNWWLLSKTEIVHTIDRIRQLQYPDIQEIGLLNREVQNGRYSEYQYR